jgi:hypothetical protein
LYFCCFRKVSFIGETDYSTLKKSINEKWNFKFIEGLDSVLNLYVLLNMLARYGSAIGRIDPADSHAMGHFIEDYGPAVAVCTGQQTDLERTVLLGAMKLGVSAVVGSDFPFQLGRRIVADSEDEIVESIIQFPSLHRKTDLNEISKLPDYLDRANIGDKFESAVTWGGTDESYILIRKNRVEKSNRIEIIGNPPGSLGIVITVDAEPLDCYDRLAIEEITERSLNMLKGLHCRIFEGRIELALSANAEYTPQQIGEVVIGSIRHYLCLIENISVRQADPGNGRLCAFVS